MTDPAGWVMIRHLLAVRSGDRCEVTGERNRPGLDLDVHHRWARGMGGTDQPWIDWLGNLVLVRHGVHMDLHAHPGRARTCGLIVAHHAGPWDVPIVLWSGRRVLLDLDNPLYLPPPTRPPYGVPWVDATLTP